MARTVYLLGFLGLPLPDQMNLLQSTWLDILCLNLAYRSTPYRGKLVFADDFQCSEEDSVQFEAPVELDIVTRKLSVKLSDLNVTREEYMMMKAMLLFNPGRPNKTDKKTVKEFP